MPPSQHTKLILSYLSEGGLQKPSAGLWRKWSVFITSLLLSETTMTENIQRRVYLGIWFQRDKSPWCWGIMAARIRPGSRSGKLRDLCTTNKKQKLNLKWSEALTPQHPPLVIYVLPPAKLHLPKQWRQVEAHLLKWLSLLGAFLV